VTLTEKAIAQQQAVFDREIITRYDGLGPRYTSYPTADRFTPDFAEPQYRAALGARAPGTLTKPLSLYFHLPFCNTVCFYCACNKVVTKDRSRADRYLDCLIREMEMQVALLPHRPKVWQLHFGGGTPTFLSDQQLERLMLTVRRLFDLQPGGEYSIEIDPRKVKWETVELLARLGFNRMSIGIQDFNPAVQKAVNRIQSEEETRLVIDAARACGFRSVSVDLIYGLPLQTPDTVRETLARVLALRPDRIALYNYAHLPERFMPQRRIESESLPLPETKLCILENSIAQIQDAGYAFIGMDHFALPDDDLAIAQRRGRLHRNFQGYSTHADCDLMAFGVSAIGKIGATYSQNVKAIEDYEARVEAGSLPVERGIALSKDDLLRRSVIQSLMCQFDLSFQPVEITYLIDFKTYFSDELQELASFADDGLLTLDEDGIHVEPRGRLLIRSIAMVFDRRLREARTQAKFSRLI